MNYCILDIETLALPEADIRASIPPFDPDKVPLGNASKPDTISAIIEKARLCHGDDIVAKAALYPEYGQVAISGLMFGAVDAKQYTQIPETTILHQTWQRLTESLEHSNIIAGWNIKGFDLPFLVKRSWILGVKVPTLIFNPWKPRYPWAESIVDLMEVYTCGVYAKFTSQNAACRALGIEVNEGSGADFGELWNRDKKAALEYNACDLRQASQLAERLIG